MTNTNAMELVAKLMLHSHEETNRIVDSIIISQLSNIQKNLSEKVDNLYQRIAYLREYGYGAQAGLECDLCESQLIAYEDALEQIESALELWKKDK